MGPLTVKGTWEVQITGYIPFDANSDPITGPFVQHKKIIRLLAYGNFGPPTFLAELED